MSAAMLKLIPVAPDQDVIRILEEALELAKSGEIISIVYAAEMADGAVQTALTRTHKNAFTMFGAIERMKMRFYSLYLEE